MSDGLVTTAITGVKTGRKTINGAAGPAVIASAKPGKALKLPKAAKKIKVTAFKSGISFVDARAVAKNRTKTAKAELKAAQAAQKAANKASDALVKPGEKLTKSAAAATANATAVPKNKDLKLAAKAGQDSLKVHSKQVKITAKTALEAGKQVSRLEIRVSNAEAIAVKLEREINSRTASLS